MCRTSIHGSWPAQVHTPGNPPNKPFFLWALFVLPFGKRIWKSWVPLRCKFFLWLALLNHCCTADRLPKWGLLHRTSLPSLWLGGKKICSTFPFPLVVSPSSVWVSFLGSNSWRWQILRMMEWIPQTGWQTIQERFEHLDHSCHLGNLETLQDCIFNSVPLMQT